MNPNQPLDQWTSSQPASDQALDALRQATQIDLALLGRPTAEFTCDQCGRRNVCLLAYDSYNTNGDCLYDK